MLFRSSLKFLWQLLILWLITQAGYMIVNWLSLPIPGNVVGMILLFLLLMTGVLKLEWIEYGAAFLLKHLAFFFIPITVGVMTLGPILLKYGLSITFILIISAAIGMITTGKTTQYVLKNKDVS